MTVFIGIDPGLTGGIAAIDIQGRPAVHDLPTKPLPGNGLITKRIDGRALAHLIRALVPATEGVQVILEQVGAMGGQDNAVQIQASLGRTMGAIEAALDILGLTPIMVIPGVWKRSFGLKRIKGETDAKFKARHVALARELYPTADLPLAKHHNRAEALLLAHFGKGRHS